MSKRITIRVSEEEHELLEAEAKREKKSLSALVRSSLFNKQKEPEELVFRELGSVGLSRWGGRIREEFLPELRGREGVKRFREMSENDATVGAVLFAIEQSIRRINWEVRPATDSEEDVWAAKFVEECLDDMSHSFQDFISEVLTFLVFGWSYFEIVYKRRLGPDADPPSKFRDGYIGWRKFAIRAQESLFEWKFDEEGGIQGLVQVAEPDYKHRFIPIEKSLLFRTKIIKNNPEGRSVLRNCYRCFSDDTEILTKRGWLLFSELQPEEEVASLDPKTGIFSFKKIKRRFVYDYKGKMFHQRGRFFDLLTTPNHRFWIRPIYQKNWTFCEAKDLPRRYAMKRDAIWEGEEKEFFFLPEVSWEFGRHHSGKAEKGRKRLKMDDWLEFLGYFLAEGNTFQKGAPTFAKTVILCQNEGPVLERIKAVLKRLGFHFTEKSRSGEPEKKILEIVSTQLYSYLKQFGKAWEKFIPTEIKGLSRRQLGILWNALHAGDGTYSGSGTKVYATTSKQLADDISEIALKLGFAPLTRLRSRKDSFGKRPLYLVSFGKPRAGGNHLNQGTDQREWVDYEGKVYCVEVENHLVYVRRNGKSCWSGNSWYFKKCIEEIEGIGIERDLAGMPVVYLPPGFTSEAEAGSSSDEAVAKRLVRRVRRDELEGIVLPGPKADNREAAELGGWLFELLSTGGRRQFDTTEIINRYDRRIAMSVLAQWLLLGMERVGSYALSRNQSDFFLMALEGWTSSIAGVLNRFAIPRLFKLNNFKMNPPKLVPAPLARPDLSDILKVLAFLSGVGLDVSDLEDYLRNLAGLPSRPKEEAKEPAGVEEKEFPEMQALIKEASEIYKESSSAAEDFAIFWTRRKSLPSEASQLVLKEALLFSLAQLSRDRGGFSNLSADDFRSAVKASERLVKEYEPLREPEAGWRITDEDKRKAKEAFSMLLRTFRAQA